MPWHPFPCALPYTPTPHPVASQKSNFQAVLALRDVIRNHTVSVAEISILPSKTDGQQKGVPALEAGMQLTSPCSRAPVRCRYGLPSL
jgi:hypothetical protein